MIGRLPFVYGIFGSIEPNNQHLSRHLLSGIHSGILVDGGGDDFLETWRVYLSAMLYVINENSLLIHSDYTKSFDSSQ